MRITAKTSGPSVALVIGFGLLLSVGILGQGCDIPVIPDGGEGNTGLTGDFVGSETCSACHLDKFDHWADTLHAGALATLEAIGQDTNEVCLACHTIGFGENGGFVNRATTNALADVGCESCHGAAADHLANPSDLATQPTVDIASSVCGRCHTGSHHPTFDEWQTSGHAAVLEHPADSFVAGRSLNSCGTCHSGDFRYASVINGEDVPDDALQGVTMEALNAVTCVICHDPHSQTGNAFNPDEGRDFQLRYPEAVDAEPSNTVADATDPTRFGICGQCHHSRGRTWDATSRGPHHSVQANTIIGEMPLPESDPTPLVTSRTSVHKLGADCSGCHMVPEDLNDPTAPAISRHTFGVDYEACAACHGTADAGRFKAESVQLDVQEMLDEIETLLGDVATWEYTSDGGPPSAEDCAADSACLLSQDDLSDAVKQVRFLYHYVINDGSLGVHNPSYTKAMLRRAVALLADGA